MPIEKVLRQNPKQKSTVIKLKEKKMSKKLMLKTTIKNVMFYHVLYRSSLVTKDKKGFPQLHHNVVFHSFRFFRRRIFKLIDRNTHIKYIKCFDAFL